MGERLPPDLLEPVVLRRPAISIAALAVGPVGSSGRIEGQGLDCQCYFPAEEPPAEVGKLRLFLLYIAKKNMILVGGGLLKTDPRAAPSRDSAWKLCT